jgi:hypothetical protein
MGRNDESREGGREEAMDEVEMNESWRTIPPKLRSY